MLFWLCQTYLLPLRNKSPFAQKSISGMCSEVGGREALRLVKTGDFVALIEPQISRNRAKTQK
jgi:hypothetical protein